jgi:hypothetical protein
MDLQLGLRINLRIVGEQQIAVSLLRIGFLRVFVHNDSAVKNPVSVIVEYAVVKLPATAVRAGMLNQHVVVYVLMVTAEEQAIDQALSSCTTQNRMNIVPH